MMRITNPYARLTGGEWLRGNLHAHTNKSDGQRAPQEVIDDYASRGYHFLMLSDHDRLTDPAKLNPRGMIMISGNEISRDGPHLLHVGAQEVVMPHSQRQDAINEALAQGGFVIVNHPNWYANFDHCSMAQLLEWTGYTGIEIYNGVIGRLDGSPYATNKWDMLLHRGRRIWGFANDDSHLAQGEVGLGWNVAYVQQRTRAGVMEALCSGRFYASTGVQVSSVSVEENRIRLETSNARRIVALKQVGKRVATVDAAQIEVEVPEDATYVRFECWGDGEQFAWTQPFFVEAEPQQH